MGVKLPRDLDNHAIQLLTPDHASIANEDVDGSSDVLALPSGAEIVLIAANTDCWILFTTSGGSVSNSTGEFFPKGAVVYPVPAGATHLAHIQDSEGGRISITKLT